MMHIYSFTSGRSFLRCLSSTIDLFTHIRWIIYKGFINLWCRFIHSHLVDHLWGVHHPKMMIYSFTFRGSFLRCLSLYDAYFFTLNLRTISKVFIMMQIYSLTSEGSFVRCLSSYNGEFFSHIWRIICKKVYLSSWLMM